MPRFFSEATRLRMSESAKRRGYNGHHTEGKRGAENHNWRGGVRIINGYRQIKVNDGRTKSGYVCEHRLVMERHIGRQLLPNEVVHHLNGNKLDNRLENLELLTHSEHARLHGETLRTVRTVTCGICRTEFRDRYSKSRATRFCSRRCGAKSAAALRISKKGIRHA